MDLKGINFGFIISIIMLVASLFFMSQQPPFNYNTMAYNPQLAVEILPYPRVNATYVHAVKQMQVDVFPEDNKTITNVEFGNTDVGPWTAATRNTSDWQIWTSAGTYGPGIHYVRLTQQEPLGISQHVLNFTSQNYTGSALPGCSNVDDCALSGTVTITTGNYSHRSVTISGASSISITGNVTIVATESFSIGAGATITIASANPSYVLNISTFKFTNQGTLIGTGAVGYAGSISGAGNPCSGGAWGGAPGAKIYIRSQSFNNTGSITSNGGDGGSGAASCCVGSWCWSTCPATEGGQGGLLNVTTTIYQQTGTVNLLGGTGGISASCIGYSCASSGAGLGGVGGQFQIIAVNKTDTGTVSVSGGAGGAGSGIDLGACGLGSYCRVWGANGNNGGNGTIVISSNYSITNTHTALGGSGGSGGIGCSAGSSGTNGMWNASYCANGTGMDWTKFNPVAITSAKTCQYPPDAAFVVPNSTSTYLALYENITTNLSTAITTNITYFFQLSINNGSTWEQLDPSVGILIPTQNNTSIVFDTHRRVATPNAKMRMFVYNNTSQIFSDWIYSDVFNITAIPTNLSNYSDPSPIISNAFTIICNYTYNTTFTPVSGATPYVWIDSTAYPLTFNLTNRIYYYENNVTFLAGNHSYYCSMYKADYVFGNTSSFNTSFMIGGFGVIYAGGSVRFLCPFPTISGIQPAYQTASKGVIRIANYNNTYNSSYSISLNQSSPPGTILYVRCDRYSPSTSGWHTMSGAPYLCLNNVSYTNNSSYMWMRADCAGATIGTYNITDMFNITES